MDKGGLKEMDFELDSSHDNYIAMTVSGGVDKAGLISAISQLVQHPEYLDKHSFWDFTKADMGLTMGDLSEIIGVLRLYKPAQSDFADKSALLIPGKMNQAMVNVFVTLAKVLPFKYKVFNDSNKAKSFLSS
jgi:hypothetical protein